MKRRTFRFCAVGCLGLDIAVARMWAVGDDPKGDKRARCRGVEAVLDGPRESLRVGDHVVAGGEQHERVGIDPRRNECGDARRRCGVPANGLQNEVINCYADLLKLFGNQKAVPMIGKNGELAEDWAGEPAAGQLEQGLRAGEPMKLLWVCFPR